MVRLQTQASFGNRSQTDQNTTVNKEDKLLGFVASGVKSLANEIKSFTPVYAFA